MQFLVAALAQDHHPIEYWRVPFNTGQEAALEQDHHHTLAFQCLMHIFGKQHLKWTTTHLNYTTKAKSNSCCQQEGLGSTPRAIQLASVLNPPVSQRPRVNSWGSPALVQVLEVQGLLQSPALQSNCTPRQLCTVIEGTE
jgi:hypothetical protein